MRSKILKNIRVGLLHKLTRRDKNSKVEIKEIFTNYYNDSTERRHTGITRTLITIRIYYWPQMTTTVGKYVKDCPQSHQ